MNVEHLAVSEVFGPTFQGEGPSLGRRAFFLRLGGCNLACSWCDTKYTWDWSQYDPRKEVRMRHPQDVVQEIEALGYTYRDLLVVTGGEPMLQQDRVQHMLRRYMPHRGAVEIETNGTVQQNDGWRKDTYFNVSPKLTGSGNEGRTRITGALRDYAQLTNARFKFVVSNPAELDEVNALLESLPRLITNDQVWIMPEGTTVEALKEKLEWLAPMVLSRGWNLTTRLHVELWGSKRGV